MNRFLWTVFFAVILLWIVAPVRASDWTEMINEDENAVPDLNLDECVFEYTVTSLPYHNGPVSMLGHGNDCPVRPSEEDIYRVEIAQTGIYSFGTCASASETDTRIYLRTGCCSGSLIGSDNNGCPTGGVASLISCVNLQAGTYYLIVETQTADGAGLYELDIWECGDPCQSQYVAADTVISNADGSFTWIQTTDSSDHGTYYDGPWTLTSTPCMTGQSTYGFGYYSWYNQDYGWRHAWPGMNTTDLCITSARLFICAWDVDESDCEAGRPGQDVCERDSLFVDGLPLNGYLTGTSHTWHMTVFDVPLSSLTDDGQLNVHVNIDAFNTSCNWATTIYRSQLVVDYRIHDEFCNRPPFTPDGDFTPCTDEDGDMCVNMVRPDPADPDVGDVVTYLYTWEVAYPENPGIFVSTSQTGPCIYAEDSHLGETWKVTVWARDSHGLLSEAPWVHHFLPVVLECGSGGLDGWDYGDLPSGYSWIQNDENQGGPANPVWANNIAWLGNFVSVDQIPILPGHDNGDGDDGVLPLGDHWIPCMMESIQVTITTGPGYNGQPLYLYAWKDGNRDFDFDDTLCDGQAPECIIHDMQITGMTTNSSRVINIPFLDPGVSAGSCNFRFRLVSELVGCRGYVGRDEVLGETEDYIFDDLQLSVELISFNAAADGNAIKLTWATASETSNSHFDIERNAGTGFQKIATVDGATNSSTQQNYSYVDERVENGHNYSYRLLSVDLNGSRHISGTVNSVSAVVNPVQVADYRLYSNYPNPFNPVTTIVYDLKEAGIVNLVVFDILGQTVATLANGNQTAGRYTVQFDGQNLSSGVYFYRLETNGFSDMKKMILMK